MDQTKDFILEFLSIFFTSRCNLRCKHCGYDFESISRFFELPASFFLDALKQAKELGAHTVNITGGEIFARKDVFELIEGAISMGYFVTLESNSLLLDADRISRLSRNHRRMRISVSLDGLRPESHEEIRGPGTFYKTVSRIKALVAAEIPVRVNTILHAGNADEIVTLARYCVDELGTGFRLLPSILEHDAATCGCNTFGASWELIDRVLSEEFFDFIRSRRRADITVALNPALVPIDIECHALCAWGQSTIGLGHDGRVGLCHIFTENETFCFGDLSTSSLSSIWTKSRELARFRSVNPDDLEGVCGSCLARGVCRGGCRLHAISRYGDFLAPDPQCQTVFDLGRFPEHALEKADGSYRAVAGSQSASMAAVHSAEEFDRGPQRV